VSTPPSFTSYISKLVFTPVHHNHHTCLPSHLSTTIIPPAFPLSSHLSTTIITPAFPPSSHLSTTIIPPAFPPSSHLSTTIIPPAFPTHICPPPSSHLPSLTPVYHHHHTCLPYSHLSTSPSHFHSLLSTPVYFIFAAVLNEQICLLNFYTCSRFSHLSLSLMGKKD
ncbi:hypothetical protein Pcinc_022442, partial [Petrolisthes cinctipes]